MEDKTNSEDYKYILVDRSDPLLMWNCAVSIIAFLLLLFFIFSNWKPKCSKVGIFENMAESINLASIKESIGGYTVI